MKINDEKGGEQAKKARPISVCAWFWCPRCFIFQGALAPYLQKVRNAVKAFCSSQC